MWFGVTLALAVAGFLNTMNVPDSLEQFRINFYRWTPVVGFGLVVVAGWVGTEAAGRLTRQRRPNRLAALRTIAVAVVAAVMAVPVTAAAISPRQDDRFREQDSFGVFAAARTALLDDAKGADRVTLVESELGSDWARKVAPRFDARRAVLLDDRWASVREDFARVWIGDDATREHSFVGLDDAAQQWRTEHGLPALPRLAVVTRALDLDPGLALFEGPRPILVAPATAPATRRERLGEVADLLLCGEAEVDLTAVLAELTAQGLGQVLCEGGPELFASLVAVDAVDELCLTLSPLLVSGSATRITRAGDQVARRMRRAHVIEGTDMLFLRYTRAS